MHRTFHDFCLGFVHLPDWMTVTAVMIEREGEAPVELDLDGEMPGMDGPFTIRIDVRPGLGAPSL